MANSAQPDQAQEQQQQDPNWAPTPRGHAQYSKTSAKITSSTNQDSRNNEGEGMEEEDEEDEYEKRIARTGCSAENEALQMCYAEKHDWRACKDAMTAFRDCWKRNGNVEAEI
ncbi:hypothetical protein BGZ80_008695 [Entomortierella chlamydospora]|uniref:CHCH domain-containing protein n=1 Tax=Entomortierella chlamydospora TaxID=101097 RepID=A0A9P6MX10_9FUNG|nr:hypothetical protein BGZ79_006674 [Entomortierella chlamydospora]KAG0017012.1 hypothetical protein BGZ80_008695 [Entomortierella chlamydospora]